MTRPVLLALVAGAALLLSSCGAPTPVDPTANLNGSAVVNSNEQTIPQTEPVRDTRRDDATRSAGQEPSMPEPKPEANPPASRPPTTRPEREVDPAPLVRPDEVDPPHRDPGDEVPL